MSGPAASRRRRGLTLLEVLAATMIFSLVMTALIGTSTSGVRRAGEAARRLEASELADAVVADLEIQMRQGVAPQVEREEWQSEDEVYTVRVQNRTIQEALEAPTTSLEEQAAVEAGTAPTEAFPASGQTRIGGAGGGIAAMLAAELPEVTKHLRQYDVEVAWQGSNGPQSITRTTFAFDWQTAKVELADLFPQAGGAEGQGEQGAQGNAPRSGREGNLPNLGPPTAPQAPRGRRP